MKVILFMAMSLNGIIARKNGSEDFLSDEGWTIFKDLVEKSGCLITSRKTYEIVSNWKDFSLDNIKAKKIIISKNSSFNLKKNYILANSPKDAIKKVSKLDCREVILCSGSILNKSFFKQKLVNELVIDIEPVIVGNGIRLFADGFADSKLKLINVKKLSESIIQLHYKVL